MNITKKNLFYLFILGPFLTLQGGANLLRGLRRLPTQFVQSPTKNVSRVSGTVTTLKSPAYKTKITAAALGLAGTGYQLTTFDNDDIKVPVNEEYQKYFMPNVPLQNLDNVLNFDIPYDAPKRGSLTIEELPAPIEISSTSGLDLPENNALITTDTESLEEKITTYNQTDNQNIDKEKLEIEILESEKKELERLKKLKSEQTEQLKNLKGKRDSYYIAARIPIEVTDTIKDLENNLKSLEHEEKNIENNHTITAIKEKKEKRQKEQKEEQEEKEASKNDSKKIAQSVESFKGILDNFKPILNLPRNNPFIDIDTESLQEKIERYNMTENPNFKKIIEKKIIKSMNIELDSLKKNKDESAKQLTELQELQKSYNTPSEIPADILESVKDLRNKLKDLEKREKTLKNNPTILAIKEKNRTWLSDITEAGGYAKDRLSSAIDTVIGSPRALYNTGKSLVTTTTDVAKSPWTKFLGGLTLAGYALNRETVDAAASQTRDMLEKNVYPSSKLTEKIDIKKPLENQISNYTIKIKNVQNNRTYAIEMPEEKFSTYGLNNLVSYFDGLTPNNGYYSPGIEQVINCMIQEKILRGKDYLPEAAIIKYLLVHTRGNMLELEVAGNASINGSTYTIAPRKIIITKNSDSEEELQATSDWICKTYLHDIFQTKTYATVRDIPYTATTQWYTPSKYTINLFLHNAFFTHTLTGVKLQDLKDTFTQWLTKHFNDKQPAWNIHPEVTFAIQNMRYGYEQTGIVSSTINALRNKNNTISRHLKNYAAAQFSAQSCQEIQNKISHNRAAYQDIFRYQKHILESKKRLKFLFKDLQTEFDSLITIPKKLETLVNEYRNGKKLTLYRLEAIRNIINQINGYSEALKRDLRIGNTLNNLQLGFNAIYNHFQNLCTNENLRVSALADWKTELYLQEYFLHIRNHNQDILQNMLGICNELLRYTEQTEMLPPINNAPSDFNLNANRRIRYIHGRVGVIRNELGATLVDHAGHRVNFTEIVRELEDIQNNIKELNITEKIIKDSGMHYNPDLHSNYMLPESFLDSIYTLRDPSSSAEEKNNATISMLFDAYIRPLFVTEAENGLELD